MVIGGEPDKAEVVAIRHEPVEDSGAELQPCAVPADRRGFGERQARCVELIDGERAPARGEEPQDGEKNERTAGDQDAAGQKAPHVSARPVWEPGVMCRSRETCVCSYFVLA